MSPLAGELATLVPVTAGGVAVEPSTLWPLEFVIWWVLPSSSLALVPAALRIVPPFSANAVDPTLTPSASTSADCTT